MLKRHKIQLPLNCTVHISLSKMYYIINLSTILKLIEFLHFQVLVCLALLVAAVSAQFDGGYGGYGGGDDEGHASHGHQEYTHVSFLSNRMLAHKNPGESVFRISCVK
jgi:hypothetical protein